MSERGLPTETAPACPFVAFEDDRDGRATAPDHRHRCFAEPRPAPRALAHQEAYCLASAFPVCPTFQDWARREAAAARPGTSSQDAPRDEAPQSRPMPPLERDPSRPPAGETAQPVVPPVVPPAVAPSTPSVVPPSMPPRRPPHRDWAAPPPWAGDEAAAGAVAAGAVAAGAAGAAGFDDDRYAPPLDDDLDVPYAPPRDDDRYAPPRDDDRYAPPRDDDRFAPPREPAPAPEPARDAARRPAEYPSEARGLAGSAADRLAGADPYEPVPARPTGAAQVDDLDDWAAGAAGAAVAGTASRATPPPRRREPAPRRDDGRPSSHDQVSKPPQQDPSELFGPAWERPRRYEAYPTLRTRIGLPALGGVPRVAVWGLLLVLVAFLLFLFGPSLLGFGNDKLGAGASATPAASAGATQSVAPTQPPAPTPQIYIVAKNDTMSRIAKKFGLTLAELMAANPQVKNPNRINLGDKITIPVPVQGATGGDGTVKGASSAAP